MRGISEYFRDLAAEDRYFGAEPPTPDAEMLHRIAEREVQRRVEAQVDDHGVKLRQLEPNEDQAPQEEASPTQAVAPALAAVRAAAVAEVVQDPTPAPASAPSSTESVAEKLARIRAVVSEKSAPAEATYQEDDPVIDAFASTPISAAFDEDVETVVPFAEPEEVEEEAQALAPSQEAQDELDVVETDDVDEDVSFDAAPEDMDAVEEDHVEEEPVQAEAEEAPADPAPEEETEAAAEDESFDIRSFFQNQGTADVEPEAEEEAVEPEVEAVAEDEVEVEAEADVSDDQIEDDAESAISRLMEIQTASDDTVEEAEAEADTDLDPEEEAAEIARVVKMRRSDFEAAAAQFEDADHVEEEPAIEATAAEFTPVNESEIRALTEALEDDEDEVESTLSPEDEAELMSNLEEVQRLAEVERRAEKEGRVMLETDDIEANTGSVSRLLEVTNTEMEETEGTRRRSAIAHLKAAVAATRADKFLSKKREAQEADEMNQYRDDLARVVRPKRPISEKPKSERRLAPLMLVSEQRVDEDSAEEEIVATPAAAVRPRRVTSVAIALEESDIVAADGDENIFRDAGSFAEFAQDMGASELPDLLEAAAAYYSFVEGREHFSRPQIMKAVAALDEEKVYSREEGLRSFGMLLRRGKIHKIKRGQFKVAESTRFNPEARAAGE
ncbi:MAG: hypothetical protein ACSHXD_12935 [Marinosulfonomonas sp.]